MNMYIRQIMKLLNIDSETAFKVYEYMELDFSECTTREFNNEAKAAYETIKLEK